MKLKLGVVNRANASSLLWLGGVGPCSTCSAAATVFRILEGPEDDLREAPGVFRKGGVPRPSGTLADRHV